MDARLRRAIREIAAVQHGLLARWQLRAAGVPGGVITWACRSGMLVRYRYGVFLVPALPGNEVRPLLAACLAAGPGAVASHWSAGALHRLKGVAPGAIELTVPPGWRTRLRGVVVHQANAAVVDDDRCCVRAVPSTSVARTLIDLAGSGRIWLVERALDDALIRQMCTLAEVSAAVERAWKRPGAPAVRELLVARQGEQVDSHQELRWLRAIRREIGLEPKLHYKVAMAEGVFEVDIAWPESRVGLEVNGWSSHGSRSAFDHDARKGLLLMREGWHVGTVTSATPEREVVAVAKTLLARYGATG